jgi:Protein of unknown function (DUF3185)
MALLVVGVVLIIFGMQASASLGSRLSELFTGAPTDQTIWLVIAYLDTRGAVIHAAVSWRARRRGAAPLASFPHRRP